MLKLNIYNWKLLIRKFISIGLKKNIKDTDFIFLNRIYLDSWMAQLGKREKAEFFSQE